MYSVGPTGVAAATGGAGAEEAVEEEACANCRCGSLSHRRASLAPLAAGIWLVTGGYLTGDYAIVDEFNIVFIVINTLVGFTTARKRGC